VAIVHGKQFMTYAELERKAVALAQRLGARGVNGDLVGVHLERSPEMLVALLGIWKAGAAYVPLDPTYPRDRLEFMLRDAGLGLVITQAEYEPTLRSMGVQTLSMSSAASHIPSRPQASLAAQLQESLDQTAYVIYTSGSTGKPKGVRVSHRALHNFLMATRETPGLSATDTLLAVTTLSFEIAALELYLP
jgi:polyketide synthase PksJ